MPKVTYNNKNAVFFPTLKKAVDEYFTVNGIKKTGNWQLYTKTIVLFLAAMASYACLMSISVPCWAALLLCVLLGMALAGIGFDVMHDALHGSYSSKKWVNDLLGLSLNALGGNAFFWKQKHNIVHHTYTNVDGVDDDIAQSPFIRMCTTQKWVPAHKVQHLYVPFLYMLSSFFWVFFSDMSKYFKKRIYTTPLTKMDTKEHVIFWVSKILYVLFYVALPIKVWGFLPWLAGFGLMHAALGFTMTLIFQLAHVVEETEFEYTNGLDPKHIENEWAIHQLKTTSNFAPSSKLLSWYVGGLNFQVEHHLFPRISHIHYPAISKIVKAKCEEHGISHHSIPNLVSAISSHFRFIKSLGKKPVQVLANNTGVGMKNKRGAEILH
ncbi:MAG: acyl-CoA desaturase [Edaphocola sp.]